jgi:phenylacetate-CoA ligase
MPLHDVNFSNGRAKGRVAHCATDYGRAMVLAKQAERALVALERFYAAELDDVLSESATRGADRRALELFHDVSLSVPGYSAFLAEHGVDPEAVRALTEFYGPAS